MKYNEISGKIIGVALKVHTKLGPGILESAYAAVLARELRKSGLRVQAEVPVPIEWDGEVIEVGFRADIIVEDALIVELKSVERLAPVHHKQLLTYLRLADKRLGLLINFGEEHLMDGVVRIVNGFDDRENQ